MSSPLVGDRRVEVAPARDHAVSRGAAHRALVEVDPDDMGRGTRARECEGESARPGAQIEREPARREERHRARDHLLALPPRDVDAGVDEDLEPGEVAPPRDPGQGFAVQAPFEHGAGGRLVLGGEEEIERLVLGGDEAVARERRHKFVSPPAPL